MFRPGLGSGIVKGDEYGDFPIDRWRGFPTADPPQTIKPAPDVPVVNVPIPQIPAQQDAPKPIYETPTTRNPYVVRDEAPKFLNKWTIGIGAVVAYWYFSKK